MEDLGKRRSIFRIRQREIGKLESLYICFPKVDNCVITMLTSGFNGYLSEFHGIRMGLTKALTRRPWPSTRKLLLVLLLQFIFLSIWEVEAICVPNTGCETAYAYYRVQRQENLDTIGNKFQTNSAKIMKVNPSIVDINYVVADMPLYIPFRCDCINDQLLQKFNYQVVNNETADDITTNVYENLTQQSWIAASNSLADVTSIPAGTFLVIPVNCSCGDPTVSPDYGLFLTYALGAGTGANLSGLATMFNTTMELLRRYNPSTTWDNSQATQHIFIPVKDQNGNYPAYTSGTSNEGKTASTGVIAGTAIGGAVVFLTLLAFALYCLCVHQPRKRQMNRLKLADPLFHNSGGSYSDHLHSSSSRTSSNPGSASFVPTALADYTVDKSVEFSYEELASATNNFSVANKIGEGGFAMVFYGVIRGQKLAIKRMNLQATREFMAELQVLTHVHHTNLVQLIGYCTTEYLFLIYEFVENGTLDQHLHSRKAGKPPLSWSSRVQIALDAARGLEYIHEHTKPTYIHRDIKSANILLDKQLQAKVADFGLTKLTESKMGGNSTSLPTRVVGTWGYMSPEYARFGEVSPMLDVYAFGVVLFEILSGREAILRGVWSDSSSSNTARPKEEQRALVTLFDTVLKDPNGKEKLAKLIDPALHDAYPIDSAWKMTQLAGVCTQELPEMRPTMRKAVVALMTLSSSTQEWEVSAYAKDGGIMAGR